MNRRAFLFSLCLLSIVLAVYSLFRTTQPIPSKEVTEQIHSALQQTISAIEGEAIEMLPKLKEGNQVPSSLTQFVVLEGSGITSWSSNQLIPAIPTLTDSFTLKFFKTGHGEFIAKKWEIEKGRSLVAIIPLHLRYKISNQYLEPYWNEDIFRTSKVSLVEPRAIQGFPILVGGKVLFKVLLIPGSNIGLEMWGALAILSFSIALVILLFFGFQRINSIAEASPAIGFLILLAFIASVRVSMIAIDFPGRLINSPLFDPKNFASSELNPSLGDLFLNSIAVFILCLYLFKNYSRFSISVYYNSSKVLSWSVSVISVLLVLFGMLFPFVVIQTIYNNSAISLSISQSIHFDLLRIFVFLSVMVCWISSFLFMHVFVRVMMHNRKLMTIIGSLILGSVLFILLNILSDQIYFSSLIFGIISLAIVIFFKFYTFINRFTYATFVYFFVIVIAFALNGVYAIQYFDQQNKAQKQLKFANKFLVDRDYFGEYLLHETAQRISSDLLIQKRISNPLLGKDIIRQKITQVSLSGYFNRYNVDVSLYNSSGVSLTDDTISYAQRVSTYSRESFRTEYDGLFWVTSAQGKFSNKYILMVPIQRNDVNVGYVLLDLTLKRNIPKNVYPELLVDSRFQQGHAQAAISYAIISSKEIQYSAGDFNYGFLAKGNLKEIYTAPDGFINDEYLHIAVHDNTGRVAVVSSPVPPPIFRVADFSFLVIMGLTIIFLFLLVQGIINYTLSKSMYLASRIQLVLNLAFFLPLIIVSVITLGLTTQSSQEQLNNEYVEKAEGFGERVAIALDEYNEGIIDFESQFTKLATLANLDANVFYPSGHLITANQPAIFENHLLSPYINPLALKRMTAGDRSFVSTEQVGNLQFNVAYAQLFSPSTGAWTGVLAIPYFQSASSLERMQITVLSNILSIFTLIFIVLFGVSFLVTKWLTAPLQMITKTLGHISLTRENEPLFWKSEDEIGLMVGEYNRMLINLNDSKVELERSQRERAWREIAQQVAHEIKNPLTPMKLTLQQLERTIQKGEQQPDKLSIAITSLLSQVNSLDDIASSFSSLAKMPEPVISKVEVVSLIKRVINLYKEEGTINFVCDVTQANTMADDKLLGRIFSNIILNSLQAARLNTQVVVDIKLEEKNDSYLISVTDNGIGIDPSLVDKIFLPHFTTKQSGSGLGLAIAKQGIEQIGGKIAFSTTSMGTTFTIELLKG